MELINFSSESHQGPFLNLNEDGYEFDLDNELFMLFDGYGGHGVGDKCVEKLKVDVKKFYNNFISDRDATMPFFYSPKYLLEGNALINSALFTHYELYKENLKKEISARAGASGILMNKADSILTVLSTGNCRAYLLRLGKTTPIFTDDSMQLLRSDNYESHLKNIPLSGFGLFPDLHYQVREVRLTPGDKILLITDGIYGRVEEDELNSVISKPTINIKSKIKELFALSNSRGNLDNQSCMILEF